MELGTVGRFMNDSENFIGKLMSHFMQQNLAYGVPGMI
jgi:hypothetical protein